MKSLIILCLALSFFQSANLRAEVLSLRKCLEMGLKNYPGMLKYKKSLIASEYKIKGKQAAFFPEITLVFAYNRNGGEYLDESAGEIKNYDSSTYSVMLNLNQIVFSRLTTYYNYKIALIEKLLEENNLKQAEEDLFYSIKELYFSLVLYQKQIEVLKKIVERRKQTYTITKISYEAGKEKSTSVQEAEASVKQSEYDLLEKAESLKVSKSILNLMIGLDDQKEWDTEDQEDPNIKSGLYQLIQKARENSPRLKSVRHKAEMEEMNLNAYWGEYLPSLSLSASYGYGDTQFFPRYNNWAVGMSISIPIFSGNSTHYKIEESRAKIGSLNDENRLTIQELESDLKTAYKKYRMSQKRQDLLSFKLKTSRDSYRLTRLEYQQGKTSYLWLDQKENELASLELEQEQNRYQLKLNGAEIEKLICEDNNGL